MKIVVEKPTMREAKHWASLVTDIMVESGKFDFTKAEARSNENGRSITLHFISKRES